MYSIIFILLNCFVFFLGAEYAFCAISAIDQAACAAGHAPAVRAVLLREHTTKRSIDRTTGSKSNDAAMNEKRLVTIGDIDGPTMGSNEGENTWNEAKGNARGTKMGSDGDASSSSSSDYRTPQGREEYAAEQSSSMEGVEQGSSANDSSSGSDKVLGGVHGESEAECCPATVPVFDLRTTYNLRSGPAGDVWAWYRPNSRASAPSYCPNQQERRNPVYKASGKLPLTPEAYAC
ncbi:hypothetical protein PENSPDRAFT_733099 [Peniophora sp. CONT]|nr:hypothetical protein PENSPDRAFT_733099 [Peniophora sp. CONT]